MTRFIKILAFVVFVVFSHFPNSLVAENKFESSHAFHALEELTSARQAFHDQDFKSASEKASIAISMLHNSYDIKEVLNEQNEINMGFYTSNILSAYTIKHTSHCQGNTQALDNYESIYTDVVQGNLVSAFEEVRAQMRLNQTIEEIATVCSLPAVVDQAYSVQVSLGRGLDFYRSDYLVSSGRLNDAIAHLTTILDSEKLGTVGDSHAIAAFGLGEIFASTSEFKRSSDFYSISLSNERSPLTHYKKMIAHCQLGEHSEAVVSFVHAFSPNVADRNFGPNAPLFDSELSDLISWANSQGLAIDVSDQNAKRHDIENFYFRNVRSGLGC